MKKYCIISLIMLSTVLIVLCAFDCANHLWLAAIIWIGWFLLTVSETILEWHTEKSRMRYDSIKHQNDHNIKIAQMSHLHEVAIKGWNFEKGDLINQYKKDIADLISRHKKDMVTLLNLQYQMNNEKADDNIESL